MKVPKLNGKKYTVLWNAAVLPVAVTLCRILDTLV